MSWQKESLGEWQKTGREEKGGPPLLPPEEKGSRAQAPGAGEDRSQTFSETTPRPPVPLPTFHVSWQL